MSRARGQTRSKTRRATEQTGAQPAQLLCDVWLDEQHQLDIEIGAAKQRVAEQQAAVDALRGQLAQVAVQAYMGAGTSGASPMFNSTADVTDRRPERIAARPTRPHGP